ncbi:MAG: pyrroline-5-carboxylate reductase [Kaiparowitsia implicata GSE-PSE-MK54-09C]|jgi:pyrroline-5-carboxylate reductase|nr:pyrroline-5-carboxylate reductase [Kaiparowitsia implicata GSE-PSE-MK54-09C]
MTILTGILGIIGGGVMGEALLSRILEQELIEASRVMVSDPQESRRDELSQRYGVQAIAHNAMVAESAQTLLLAIKPQVFERVVGALSHPASDQLVVSILAGVPLAKLEAAFPHQPVVRAMPNTPATVGAGMTAIALGQHTKDSHRAIAHQLFTAVGKVVEVPETWMDAVTGLSGSGPGYVAIVIEALADGGVAAGLPRAIAAQLALQTVLGTAQLLHQTGLHPAELKDRVTSPGGTTITGIATLEQAGLRSALIEAVRAASHRSKELGS